MLVYTLKLQVFLTDISFEDENFIEELEAAVVIQLFSAFLLPIFLSYNWTRKRL